MIRVGDTVLVTGGHFMYGQRLKVTRIDKHVYPICAGYTRFKHYQLKVVREE